MSTTLLTTETMKFTDARQNLSRVVNRVARHETRVLVEKSGVPVAAIVSPDDLRRLNELEARRQEQFAAIAEISRAFADVPDDELERELAAAQTETRSDLREEREQLLEARRQEQFAAIGRISDAFADVPIEELERMVEQAVAETRAELRAEREVATSG